MTGRPITAAELDARIGQVHDLIRTLAGQLAAHERWHRDMLTAAAQTGAAHRIATWALAVSALAALAAIITAVTAVGG